MTGLIFQLSCSTLHFQVDLTIWYFSPPKKVTLFLKRKRNHPKTSTSKDFFLEDSSFQGGFCGVPTASILELLFIRQKCLQPSPPQSSPRADVRCPTGGLIRDSKRAKQTPNRTSDPQICFTYENSEGFFFRVKKGFASQQKIQVAKFRVWWDCSRRVLRKKMP